MKNQLKAFYWQDIQNKSDRYGWITEGQTTDDLDKNFLKAWTSLELWKWITLLHTCKAQTFNLKLPIYANVFWNDELSLELVQVLVTKDRILRKNFDFPYRLKSSIYLLIDRKDFKQDRKPNPSPRNQSYTDLNKISNAVEHQKGVGVNYKSPIIYTGMTK